MGCTSILVAAPRGRSTRPHRASVRIVPPGLASSHLDRLAASLSVVTNCHDDGFLTASP